MTTHNRPALLPVAVESALRQDFEDLEVVVVDDGSSPPVELEQSDRLRLVRVPASRGVAAARNTGTRAARGAFVSYLDDDDRLLPHFARVSMAALDGATLEPPVAVLSGIEVIRPNGATARRQFPPTMPRGKHFALEDLPRDKSFQTKQTLVVPREVIESIGGWNEKFRSRVTTELFFRLNPACSILGIPDVTYQLVQHGGARLSRTARLRSESWEQLLREYGDLFDAHPRAFTAMLLDEADNQFRAGAAWNATRIFGRAFMRSPLTVVRRIVSKAARSARGSRPTTPAESS